MSRPRSFTGRMAACALVAGVGLSLSSCAQTEKTRSMIDERAAQAQQGLDAAQHTPKNPVNYDPLTVTNKVWGGDVAIRMRHGMPLPDRYQSPKGITLVSSDPMTLSQIIDAIGAQTGIPVRASALTLSPHHGVQADSSSSSALGMLSFGHSAPTTGFQPAAKPDTGDADKAMPISYEGPLSGLLERVAAYFGIAWNYDGSSILISRYQTRIFTVDALPGTEEINEGMQDDNSSSNTGTGGSSSGSSGGTSSSTSGGTSGSTNTLTQNSKTTMGFKYWDELTQVLNSLVGSQGNVVVSPSIGTVTVTTTPEVMETVSDYLKKENNRLSQQIALNVKIYAVNLQQSEDFNVAFTAFLKNLSKFSGLNYTSASAPSDATGALTSSSLGSSYLGSLGIAILNGPNDPTAHVGDVFNALSAIGDTTNVAQFPMTTLNNRPVSRRVGTDTSYISSVTQSTITSTSTQNTYTPTVGTVHQGFSLQLTPRLLDDGRILLQYSLSLIGLDNMTTNTTYGIQLPTTDNRIFVQQSMLRSGSTLIIGGVDQESMQQTKQGVGSPDNFLLGGGTASNSNHIMMFIAITPQVMNPQGDHS
ncbi:MAG: secretin N-terminal domain-containing protein [Alphaproteobacteria bacterium]|nr:secretin N-terminal domain-containing protein [Alphaproteobacteria bacterium]